MTLPQIQSITKKIFVALLGGFLLVFLLFHMCANLCILRNDGGQWYSDFCHFMGTNVIVKVFEIALFGILLLHIALTVWLWITNRMARPVRYHHRSETRSSKGSAWMIVTGGLIFICLLLHLFDFFAVKIGIQNSFASYMVKTEEIHADEAMMVVQAAAQYQMTPEEFYEACASEISQMGENAPEEAQEQLAQIKKQVAVAEFLTQAHERTSEDGKWIKNISSEEKATLTEAIPELEIEPDFYNMARSLFHNPIISILYLLFFAVVGFHIRHAFQSAFQTLGLNNRKCSRPLDICSQIYTWIICLGFGIIPIVVLLFL